MAAWCIVTRAGGVIGDGQCWTVDFGLTIGFGLTDKAGTQVEGLSDAMLRVRVSSERRQGASGEAGKDQRRAAGQHIKRSYARE